MSSRAKKSTIVRLIRAKGSLVALRLLRVVLRALDPLAPGLTARYAMRLWCTPPGARRPDRPTTVPGERFTTALAADPRWATRARWRPPSGRQFAVPAAARGMVVAEVWGDGPRTTYLLHGWGGRREQLAGLVEPLVAAGQRVVALDALGHGESGSGRLGGRRTTLVEMTEALAAVVAVTGPAHAVIAHSAGCQAATLAVRTGLRPARLVYLAPMADPMPRARGFAELIGLGPRGWATFLDLFTRLAGRPVSEFTLPTVVARTPPGVLPPLLVIHDRADREVHHREGAAVAAAWPRATLLRTDGLGHRRILSDPAVVEAAVRFVTGDEAGNRVRLAPAARSTADS